MLCKVTVQSVSSCTQEPCHIQESELDGSLPQLALTFFPPCPPQCSLSLARVWGGDDIDISSTAELSQPSLRTAILHWVKWMWRLKLKRITTVKVLWKHNHQTLIQKSMNPSSFWQAHSRTMQLPHSLVQSTPHRHTEWPSSHEIPTNAAWNMLTPTPDYCMLWIAVVLLYLQIFLLI